MRRPLARLAALLLPLAAAAAPPPPPPAPPRFDAGTLTGLGARNIGSAMMSGRIAALGVGQKDGQTTLYVGAASGGVWRSLDGGTTFKPVFDDQPVQSIGAIAVDEKDPKNVWVGTGEAWTRNSVSVGNGVYRSTDGGETWRHLGLPESERVSKLLLDPRSREVAWACVPGKLWSDSKERGLYKTTDGGQHWALVLAGANLSTGCADVDLDPSAPDTLYAGLWDFRRTGWGFRSGGPGPTAPSGSGLFKTTDGGKRWQRLEAPTTPGLPPGPWGRLAVAVAPSSPKVVYAFIESPRSALFRSDDGGRTWEERDRSQLMVWRPFYFARLVVDPYDADRVFKTDFSLILSKDGGKSFANVGGGSHGDFHAVWVDPHDTRHVVAGDDGGLWISRDGANRWWKVNNLPVSQFYHVAADDRDPYQVYGGLQDNSSWVGDSAYPGGITNSRWENLYGGDGFWTLPDPADPGFAYAEAQGGFVSRVNRHTLKARDIQPKANRGEKLRFNWNTPLHLSPHEPGTLYIGAQFLFRTRDHGQTWDRISPDLTTDDPEKQKQEQSGGVTVDNSAAETHCTIYTISESPRAAGTIWVGTDDGRLQLTRDGGKGWRDVTASLKGLPRASWVSWVEASPHAAGSALVAFDRHTFGDVTPWVFRTDDHGQSWRRVASPEQGVRGWAHVVKEDPVKPGLLYLGTELGLWISIDGGAHWAAFKGGRFPAVAVRDLAIQPRDHDLVIGTHGRGLWIVDDLTPLRALDAAALAEEVAFLPGRPVQQRIQSQGGWVEGDAAFSGENPTSDAVITYHQRSRHLFGKLSIEILDADGHLVDTVPASSGRGLNRVRWSMRLKPPRVPPAASVAGAATQGPRVLPGAYTVRLKKGARTVETPLVVGLDRRADFDLAGRKAQLEAALRVQGLFGEMSDLVARLEALRQARPALAPKAEALRKKIVATTEGGAITGEERLREHTDQLYGALMSWEGRPAEYQLARIDALAAELAAVSQEAAALAATP